MPGDRQDLRRAVARVAAEQHGYFTAAQARDVGYSYQAQKFHVDHPCHLATSRTVVATG